MSTVVTGFFVFILSLMISLPVAAQNRLQKIKAENPGATPAEILKRLYEEADGPAEFSDFDSGKLKESNQKCVAANPFDVDVPTGTSKIALYEFIVTPGKPGKKGRGPLFPDIPATPDVIGQCLLIVSTRDSVTEEHKNKACAAATFQTDATDLLARFTEGYYRSPVEVRFRKASPFIAYQLIDAVGSDEQEEAYGYCYRE